MRQIGSLESETDAQRFGDFLLSENIPNKLEFEEGIWEIWVEDDDDLERSGQLFQEFKADPKNPRYKKAKREANVIRSEEYKKEKQAEGRYVDARIALANRERRFSGPLTIALIVASVGVAFYSRLGADKLAIDPLLITHVEDLSTVLPEIQSGQIWRLFTPCLVHFGIIHLLFNMYMLKGLGGVVEQAKGSFFFGIFVLVAGIVGNLAQFFLVHPLFGGMSGVVYGLFGYIWMMARFAPQSGFLIDRTTVGILLIWFFLGLFGLIGSIANGAHASGLIVGVIWGFTASGRLRQLFR